MNFPRTKLIESFLILLDSPEKKRIITIVWEKNIGKTTFLWLVEEQERFSERNTEHIAKEDILGGMNITPDSTTDTLIIDGDISLDISTIRTFIEPYQSIDTIIFTSEQPIYEEDVSVFFLPGISFREYSEANDFPINVGELMSGTADIESLNVQKDAYIHLGQFPTNIENPDQIPYVFSEKLSEMAQELFRKEENDFMEFIRTVAMGTWDLFKEERIAKLMNISRRKVRKYTEIILRHRLVHAVGPFVTNADTELSRHVKLYFNDLSYMNAALGVMYYQGITKQGVIENFILLELERKLSNTHEIRFHRKKSGAEMQFVLENKTTKKLTPIEVRIGNNTAISQAMKSFDETYNQFIENYMIFNESHAEQKVLGEKNVIILPHVAI